MTPAALDVRDVIDAVDTTTIAWATPHMRTASGARLWAQVRELFRRASRAESELAQLRARHDREVDDLRELCSLLTARVQDLEVPP